MKGHAIFGALARLTLLTTSCLGWLLHGKEPWSCKVTSCLYIA